MNDIQLDEATPDTPFAMHKSTGEGEMIMPREEAPARKVPITMNSL